MTDATISNCWRAARTLGNAPTWTGSARLPLWLIATSPPRIARWIRPARTHTRRNGQVADQDALTWLPPSTPASLRSRSALPTSRSLSRDRSSTPACTPSRKAWTVDESVVFVDDENLRRGVCQPAPGFLR